MVRVIVLVDMLAIVPDIVVHSKAYNMLRDSVIAATGAGFLIGLFTGLSELYFFPKFFRNRSFFKLIIVKLIVYAVSILVIAVFTMYLYQIITYHKDFLDTVSATIEMFIYISFYRLFLMGLLLSIGINFMIVMKNKMGYKIFLPIVLGRYHKPKEEDRIFLFVDMISSTRTAEQLGHIKYSNLIQDCFRDLSAQVIRYNGAIYQFVGDEAVISWQTKWKNSYFDSVFLFFSFQEVLIKKASFYQKKYGLIPEFKGSINAGKVMVAEVGEKVKSEIAFHGDVLNTASRMLELCTLYNKDLVVSETIVDNINVHNTEFEIEYKSNIQLRGKNKSKKVFSISRNTTKDTKK